MTSVSKVQPREKTQARQEMRQRLKAFTSDHRRGASRLACTLLREQGVWHRAKTILFYAPLPEELDIWPLVGEALTGGKQAFLPRFETGINSYCACQITQLETDLAVGRFGIREAAGHCPRQPLNLLDLVLAPGLAFDLHGRRLGRGKGYYDRLLSAVGGTKCGVAFDEQLLPEVPAEPHDILLNCILTPTRWIEL